MVEKVYIPRLKEHYRLVVVSTLCKKFGYKNIMQVPIVSKIVVNMGVGKAVSDKKQITHAIQELSKISGQKPIITIAKKSVSSFKLRAGMSSGCKVTLRRSRMWDFLDRLINIALPRTRDFRGLSSRSFDGHGNYALGIKEQIAFQEIDYDTISTIRGMDVVICTTAKSDAEAKSLLTALYLPLNS